VVSAAYRAYWPHGIPMRRRQVVPKSSAAPTPLPTGTGTEKRRFRRPPKFLEGTPEHVRKVVLPIVNDLQRGKANNTYEITLAVAPATTTLLETAIATLASEAFLTPKSASAAAALAAGVVYTTPQQGSILITHDSDAATDRTFGVVIHG
jgi:hypothetical protein